MMGIIINSVLRAKNRPGAGKEEFRLDMPQAVYGEIMNGTAFREKLIKGEFAQKAAALSTNVATSYKSVNDLYMPQSYVPEIDDNHAEILAEFNRLCPIVWANMLKRFRALRDNPLMSDKELEAIYSRQADGRQVPLYWILINVQGEAVPAIGLDLYPEFDPSIWPVWPGEKPYLEE